MENSFFEYRDATGVYDSDTEIIDDSIVDQSIILKTKSGHKNQTVFIAESEDSLSEGCSDEDVPQQRFSLKSVAQKSSAVEPTVISSSYDDANRRGSITRQSDGSNKLVVSSSDEEEMSPEIVRWRPTRTPRKLSNSFIGRNTRKRMFLIDSDTDNSIVIEHNKNTKHACLKDTPAKTKVLSLDGNMCDNSDEDQQNNDNSDDGLIISLLLSNSSDKEELDSNNEIINDNHDNNENDKDRSYVFDLKAKMSCRKDRSAVGDTSNEIDQSSDGARSSVRSSEDNCDEFDEDQMVMSRATRMSIMGFVPKDNTSDESDFIQSDDNSSRPSSAGGLADLPEVDTNVTSNADKDKEGIEEKDKETDEMVNKENDKENGEKDSDDSRLTCSPFTSPLKDITNEFNTSLKIDDNPSSSKIEDAVCDLTQNVDFNASLKINNKSTSNKFEDDVCDLTQNDSFHVYDLTGRKRNSLRSKVMNNIGNGVKLKERVIDDDVTIIDAQPEVIALSSDDEDDIKDEKKSPRIKKSPSKRGDASDPPKVSSDIKQYLLPPSYPNQVIYVSKQVRENELNKLQGLQQDLLNVRNLLENMDVDTLPDGGVKLIERLTALEQDVRRQGDKVASMIVEPANPSAEDIAKDGFENADKGLSWEDLQKASNAVQPRMFGKQAMATHMAERTLILDRLRDLHAALASRPPESELAPPPAALRTTLMPHQLHALAWLRWRETQRPHGGILADDMGLGKTITMIALIASDKESDAEEDDDDDERSGKTNTRMILGGTLVVCPASLMQQWAEEVSRHCQPHRLSVCLHHGVQRAQHPHRLAAHDVVLTTYNILLREAEKKGPLCRVRWRRTILDEAHAVRNHKSATAGAVLPTVLFAKRRWALTGTPLHNKDLDLFALLRYLGCSPFDDLTMWKKWIDNKSLGGQERLSTIMRCIMLRRTKVQLQERGQLACLPSRDLHERTVTLAKDEMNVYQKLLVLSKTLFAQFLHQRAEKRSDAHGALPPGKDSAYAEMHKKMVKLQGAKPVKSHEILVLLLRLRQVCCHCGLIASMLSDDDSVNEELDVDSAENDLLDELNKLVLEDKKTSKRKSGGQKEEKEEEKESEEGSTAAEAVRSVLSRSNPVFRLDRSSSKIKAVMECLNEKVFANPGEKAVVVSQWTGVLRLVEKELSRAKIACVMLTGEVPVNARAPIVAALNNAASPVRVMLLSLTAGGVGLNLCGANHLLLLDPHWNPQLEQQAQDRVYRVGQARPVHIYRFMCVDTVEQSIRQLQKVKLEMADNVLTGARNINASKLSIEDLKMLFNMGQ